MGLYVEAHDGLSKEDWIAKFGTRVADLKWPGHEAGYYPVSVVDNGAFRAALVCWLESEVRRVRSSINAGDPRPIAFFHVRHEDLRRNLGEAVWAAMQEDIEEGHL